MDLSHLYSLKRNLVGLWKQSCTQYDRNIKLRFCFHMVGSDPPLTNTAGVVSVWNPVAHLILVVTRMFMTSRMHCPDIRVWYLFDALPVLSGSLKSRVRRYSSCLGNHILCCVGSHQRPKRNCAASTFRSTVVSIGISMPVRMFFMVTIMFWQSYVSLAVFGFYQ